MKGRDIVKKTLLNHKLEYKNNEPNTLLHLQ